MKLSELRSAMRNTKGNPMVVVELVPGKPMTLTLQKTAFDKELARIFDGARTVETGMSFDEERGMILIEGAVDTSVIDAEAQCHINGGSYSDENDLDDIL